MVGNKPNLISNRSRLRPVSHGYGGSLRMVAGYSGLGVMSLSTVSSVWLGYPTSRLPTRRLFQGEYPGSYPTTRVKMSVLNHGVQE